MEALTVSIATWVSRPIPSKWIIHEDSYWYEVRVEENSVAWETSDDPQPPPPPSPSPPPSRVEKGKEVISSCMASEVTGRSTRKRVTWFDEATTSRPAAMGCRKASSCGVNLDNEFLNAICFKDQMLDSFSTIKEPAVTQTLHGFSNVLAEGEGVTTAPSLALFKWGG